MIIVLFLLGVLPLMADFSGDSIYFPLAIERNRLAREKKLQQNINRLYGRKWQQLSTEQIEDGLLAMQLLMSTPNSYQRSLLLSRLRKNLFQYPDRLRYRIVETCHTFLWQSCMPIAVDLIQKDEKKDTIALSANFLLKIRPQSRMRQYLRKTIIERFPDFRKIPELYLFLSLMQKPYNKRQLFQPDIFFQLENPKNKWLFYSIQYINRDIIGHLLVKKPNGRFLRDESGRVLVIRQFSRSITNVVGYLKSGNSPLGVFSLQGLHISASPLIGKTPVFKLFLPFETDPRTFFHKTHHGGNWSKEQYSQLLPRPIRKHLIYYEAYFGGKIGRNYIYSHGTGIPPEYYRNQPYYPLTPGRGCLIVEEWWNRKTGHLQKSDQLRLLNAIEDPEKILGFFYVILQNEKKHLWSKADLQILAEESEKFE